VKSREGAELFPRLISHGVNPNNIKVETEGASRK